MIQTKFPGVQTISNSENLGSAKANNVALPHCPGDYIFFLNPDTVIFDDTVQAAVAYMDRERKVRLAGARLLNPDGSHQASVETLYPRQRFAKERRLAFEALRGEIAWVKGTAMIVRENLVLEIGGFDENACESGRQGGQSATWKQPGSLTGGGDKAKNRICR